MPKGGVNGIYHIPYDCLVTLVMLASLVTFDLV